MWRLSGERHAASGKGGRLHLDGGDYVGTLRWLEGVEILSARNNRALALFHMGRIEDALDAFMDNWQQDSANLYALGWAARLRLYQGDADAALGLCTPLAAVDAGRLEEALVQIGTLLLLREDRAAWDAFERARTADWFDDGSDAMLALVLHLGACAACRLGEAEEALRWWREALEVDADLAPAITNLGVSSAAARSAHLPVVFDAYNLLPNSWTNPLFSGETRDVGHADALTASNHYLEALYMGGDAAAVLLIGFVLKRRAEQGDASAAELLRTFASLPIATPEECFGYLSLLKSLGHIGPSEQLMLWNGEEQREVIIAGTEIYREPKESGLPLDLEQQLSDGVRLFNDGQAHEAESVLRGMLTRVPDHPVVLGNLAATLASQGQSEAAERLLREVVDKHPDYLFARCSLA
jgi:tetratricopeptide (TPR) repeat protein